MAGPVEDPEGDGHDAPVGDAPGYEPPVDGADPPAVTPPADDPDEPRLTVEPQGADPDADTPPADDSGEQIPKYRLDKVIADNAKLEERLAAYGGSPEEHRANTERLQRLIADVAGLRPPADTPTKRNDADQAAYDRLLEVAPELATVLDPNFKARMERFDQREAQTVEDNATRQARSDVYGNAAMDALSDGFAKIVHPGSEKTGADITDAAKSYLANNFLQWVECDPGTRARYHGFDETLFPEFLTHYEEIMSGTLKRTKAAGQQNRLTSVARLPKQGGEGAPAGKPVKKLDLSDEDAVMDAAAAEAGL